MEAGSKQCGREEARGTKTALATPLTTSLVDIAAATAAYCLLLITQCWIVGSQRRCIQYERSWVRVVQARCFLVHETHVDDNVLRVFVAARIPDALRNAQYRSTRVDLVAGNGSASVGRELAVLRFAYGARAQVSFDAFDRRSQEVARRIARVVHETFADDAPSERNGTQGRRTD